MIIEVLYLLIDKMEAFDSFGEHLLFDLVEDLIWLILPIHQLQK